MKPLASLAALVLATAASAATSKVNRLAALQAAIDHAAAGDRIVLQNGAYATRRPLVVVAAGTAAAPIVIAAESGGGVELSGTHGFTVMKPAAHVAIEGFKFSYQTSEQHYGIGADGRFRLEPGSVRPPRRNPASIPPPPKSPRIQPARAPFTLSSPRAVMTRILTPADVGPASK